MNKRKSLKPFAWPVRLKMWVGLIGHAINCKKHSGWHAAPGFFMPLSPARGHYLLAGGRPSGPARWIGRAASSIHSPQPGVRHVRTARTSPPGVREGVQAGNLGNVKMSLSDLQKLVPCPPAGSVNTLASPCPTTWLIAKYGRPRSFMTQACLPVTSPFWRARMVTEDVGPFRVTGHRLAVALLRDSLGAVKTRNPGLYDALGTAGMLCCRNVRGAKSVPSNHSLGLAIDFTLGGVLDRRGDNLVQVGLFDLYAILKTFGWFWGVEFRTEDAMHFEVSYEVIRRWIAEGVF